MIQQNMITHSHKDSHTMTPRVNILPGDWGSISCSGKNATDRLRQERERENEAEGEGEEMQQPCLK